MFFFEFYFPGFLIFLFVGVDSLIQEEITDDTDFGGIATRPGRAREQRMSFMRVGKRYGSELEDKYELQSLLKLLPMPEKLSGSHTPTHRSKLYFLNKLRNGKRSEEPEEIKKSSSFATFPRIGKLDQNYSWQTKNFDYLTELQDRLQKRGDPKASSNGMWFGPRIGRSERDTQETQTESAYPLVYVMLNGKLLRQSSDGAMKENSIFTKTEKTEEK